MKWVTIIRVRAAIEERPAAIDAMQAIRADLLRSDGDLALKSIGVYRHQNIATDATLALHFEAPHIGADPTNLIAQLTASLSEFGMVESAVWHEVP